MKILIFIVFFIVSLNANELKKISLQLSWFNQFQFAGYFVGIEKGFYKDLGLKLEIKEFNFGIDVVKEINLNRADFGVFRETLILQRSNEKKVVALYALFQETPLVLLSLKKSNINSIQNFKNKKIMITKDDSSEVSIKAMLYSKKIQFQDLNLIKHTHKIDDLINKKTDIISAYISKSPYILDKKGIEYNIFNPKDYGFDMYSDFLFTNEEKISNDLDTVLSFKEASLRSWEYAFANIEESAKLIFNNYNTQNLSLEELIYEGYKLKKLAYSNMQILGNIDYNKIQRSYDLYNIMGLIKNKVNIEKFVFNARKNNLNLNLSEKNYINKNKINMCVIPNYKPYSYITDNQANGFVSEYINLLNKKAKLDIQLIKTTSTKQTFEFLKDKKCDFISSVFKNEKNVKYLSFTKPYLHLPLVLLTKDDFPFIDDFNFLENITLGIYQNLSNNSEIKKLYPNITFIEIENIKEGIKKTQESEIDGYIDTLKRIHFEINKNEYNNLKISAKLSQKTPISIGIQKDNKILNDIFNKAVNSITQEEINNILNKWVSVEYTKTVNYDTIKKVAFFILLIILALVYKQIVLKKMNSSLKGIVDEKTKELTLFNEKLQKQVKKEVSQNRQKDIILAKQAKLASMGEMLQNISHQWRQPLSIITTATSGLQIEKEIHNKISDASLDKNLKTILETSMYLSNTIDDFMFFYKPNKMKKEFKINDCINKSLNLFSSEINFNRINIIKNIDDLSITGFENELIQVILNIINNAKDAFPDKTDEDMYIFINVYENKQKNIIIEIKDNAGGVEEKILHKLFEPYFTTKHKKQGIGVGLYMCQEIISKHMEGNIEVENIRYTYNNKKHKGALFTIIL